MLTISAHAPPLHGFGPRYDLPISLALYLYGAAGVVVVSFVMVALFMGDRVGDRAITYPRLEAAWLTRIARSPAPRGAEPPPSPLRGRVGVGGTGTPQPTPGGRDSLPPHPSRSSGEGSGQRRPGPAGRVGL